MNRSLARGKWTVAISIILATVAAGGWFVWVTILSDISSWLLMQGPGEAGMEGRLVTIALYGVVGGVPSYYVGRQAIKMHAPSWTWAVPVSVAVLWTAVIILLNVAASPGSWGLFIDEVALDAVAAFGFYVGFRLEGRTVPTARDDESGHRPL